MKDIADALLRHAQAFHDAGLDFMVVGALAVAIHGAPRSTLDVDLVVNIPEARRPEVEAILRNMGHKDIEYRNDEFGSRFVATGPEGAEVEVFMTPPRSPYLEEFERRIVARYHGVDLPFIRAEDLVLRKLVNTRIRRGIDYQDVVSILQVQGPAFDFAFIRARCGLYRVCDLFERAVKDAEGAAAAT